MIKVNSSIKLNLPEIKRLTDAQITALEETAEALHQEVGNKEVVPMDKGTLSGEAFFCDFSFSKQGRVTLVHATPYARRMYFHPEYHFSKKEHANAKGEWFEDWEPGGKEQDFCINAFKRIYRRLTGL